MQTMRIETEERIMSEKQRPPCTHSNIELDPVVSVSISVVVPIRRARPPSAILQRSLFLSRPPGVIHLSRHAMGWRSHREQIRNHHFVESDQRMMDCPRPLLRPMPVQEIALRILPIPVP